MSTIAVEYSPSITYLPGYNAEIIDGVRHLRYHSRFDPEHYNHCDECWEAQMDFRNEPEFEPDGDDGCEE